MDTTTTTTGSTDNTTAIVVKQQPTAIEVAGQVANAYAGANAFADYSSRKAQNTIDAQRADLALFSVFLCVVTDNANCLPADDLQHFPASWQGVTYGLVAGFVQWLLQRGAAIASINRALSTVRTYAKLAAQAKVIPAGEMALIRTVSGYSKHEAVKVDEKRTTSRISTKKAAHVSLSGDQVAALKAQPDTPQGRRDAVLMTLLLDLGLRVGELAALQVTAVDLKARTLTFYRAKVGKTQTHKLTVDAYNALVAYLDQDAPVMGALLRGSAKSGKLTAAGMGEHSISVRVGELGDRIGVAGLSAHDLRHSWATRAAKKSDILALRDAGGWNSLAMPSRYVESAKIANEGIEL